MRRLFLSGPGFGLALLAAATLPAAPSAAAMRSAWGSGSCETAHARAFPVTPCPLGSALAWAVLPADAANHVPEILSKNGSLTGFSSPIVLMPSQGMGVVALVNASDGAPAQMLAFQIAYALYYAGL